MMRLEFGSMKLCTVNLSKFCSAEEFTWTNVDQPLDLGFGLCYGNLFRLSFQREKHLYGNFPLSFEMKRKSFKALEDIVWRWISGQLHHYKMKVPRAKPSKEIIKSIEEKEGKRKK
mgnify:CR=1 FL=1